MKIALALTLLFAGLVGYTGLQSPALRMPSFTTEQGKASAPTCQATFAEYNKSCSQMIGGAVTVQQRMQCLNHFTLVGFDLIITKKPANVS